MEEIYKVKIHGVKPLLIHAPFGIGDKPKLRRGEHLEPKVEAEGYLYKDGEGKIVIPAMNIKACIREAGRNYKVSGRKSSFASMIKAGLEIRPMAIPLIYNNEWKVDTRPVVVQRQRILRSRPRFDEWGLEFEVINKDPTVIHKETLRNIVADAGKYYGLGILDQNSGFSRWRNLNNDYEARHGKARSGLARRGGAELGVARCGEARRVVKGG